MGNHNSPDDGEIESKSLGKFHCKNLFATAFNSPNRSKILSRSPPFRMATPTNRKMKTKMIRKKNKKAFVPASFMIYSSVFPSFFFSEI